MSGYYVMARGWLDHEALAGGKFSKRDAWCWLIEQAAWRDSSFYRNGKNIIIKRGQAATTIMNMVKAWGWSQNKVVRFLKVLKMNRMLDIKTDMGFSIITICNYDIYQLTPEETDRLSALETSTKPNTIKEIKNNKQNNTPLPPKGEPEQFQLVAEDDPIDPEPPVDRFPEFIKIYPPCMNPSRKTARRAWDKATQNHSPDDIIRAAEIYAFQRSQEPEDRRKRYTAQAATWLNQERFVALLDDDESESYADPSTLSADDQAAQILQQAGLA